MRFEGGGGREKRRRFFRSLSYSPFSLLFLLFLTPDTKAKEGYLPELCRETQRRNGPGLSYSIEYSICYVNRC